MKKSLIILTFFGVFSCIENKAQNATQAAYSYEDLKPTQTQEKVEQFTTQFLSYHHYQKFKMDDSLSSKVWTNYLKEVDANHLYFTKDDINEFEKYRYSIDENLLEGNLKPAFDVFNRYRNRYKERNDYIMALLSKPQNFIADESYETNREKVAWAKSTKELDEVWRKIIKSQMLDLKLSGSKDSAVVATLKDRYSRFEKRVGKTRSEDVFQLFMNAFTEMIDPHTNYMNPSTATQFNIEMSQSLEGIGASLINEGDFVVIKDIIPGGPLFKSGLANKQDKIMAVAQGTAPYQDIVGWLTDDAVKLIRGPKGTTVRLKLLAGDAPIGTLPREIKIVREKIKLEEQVAKAEIVPVQNNNKTYNIGLITIPMFYRDFEYAHKGGDFQSTTKDVKRFLVDFKTKGVAGVVIDLRNNGGGSLTEAVNLSGLFITKGPVVQRKDNQGVVDVEEDNDPEEVYAGPLAILQNRFSASASEIFAGAIQDYHRGVIIGEQSYGKGTVQQLIDLDAYFLSPRTASNNKTGAAGFEQKEKYGQLKMTTEKFYRITGNSTQRKGVLADIELPSALDTDEFGESSQPTALPYDQIKSSDYTDTKVVGDKQIIKLREKSGQRFKSDKDLLQLKADLADYRKMKDITVISLNEEKRKKERDENQKKKNAINKTKGDKKDKELDFYLIEAEKIVSDMVSN